MQYVKVSKLQSMRVAITGCCHGQLDKMYATIRHMEKRDGMKIELLISCGDFQAVRNTDDLDCMAVPQKHRKMCDFHKYYSGQARAPILTIFVGGNHGNVIFMLLLVWWCTCMPALVFMEEPTPSWHTATCLPRCFVFIIIHKHIEASNYLLELAHGGWVAPNIYYMGWSNVINFGGLRIAGLSGIFKVKCGLLRI